MDKENMNLEELKDVTGGNDGMGINGWVTVKANVKSGYLALRNFPSYDEKNEIASIYNGEYFKAYRPKTSGVYVWAAAKGCEGWVNSDYVIWC